MRQIPTCSWLNAEQLHCLDGIVLLLNASPCFTTFGDCSFLSTPNTKPELGLGGKVNSLHRTHFASNQVHVDEDGLMWQTASRSHEVEEVCDVRRCDMADQQCAMGGEGQLSTHCAGIQFLARLNVVTFNTLSADEDRSCGLNYQASLTWITNRLKACDADIVGLQETRLCLDKQGVKVQGYTVHSAPPNQGRGGLMALVRECDYIKCRASSVVSDRILLVELLICGNVTMFVVAHAPTRGSEQCEHDAFARDFAALLKNSKQHAWTLVTADLNVRVKGLESLYPDVVGSQGVTVCSKKAMHARGLLRLMQS
eukprot:3513830-Amphidinium_carterae.1